MSKKFTYEKRTGHYFCQSSQEWEEDFVEFDYEVEDEYLIPVIAEFMFEEYFRNVDKEDYANELISALRKIIEEKELVEILSDKYEERLKEFFKKEALDFYND